MKEPPEVVILEMQRAAYAKKDALADLIFKAAEANAAAKSAKEALEFAEKELWEVCDFLEEHNSDAHRSDETWHETLGLSSEDKPRGSSDDLVYLAIPYSHADPTVKEQRFRAANRAAAKLMKAGVFVFSPISHTHPIAAAGDLPSGWKYWQYYDRAMLRRCQKLIVLKLDGWEKSEGVADEITIARGIKIPIEYMEEDPE